MFLIRPANRKISTDFSSGLPNDIASLFRLHDESCRSGSRQLPQREFRPA